MGSQSKLLFVASAYLSPPYRRAFSHVLLACVSACVSACKASACVCAGSSLPSCRAWSAVLQVRIQDLVSELGAREDELHRLRLERDDLRRLVASLDAERDRVQVGEVRAMDRLQVGELQGMAYRSC